MNTNLADFTEKLISVSDFTQGKASKIFSDVADNNKEYIILKNNQPTAVLVSMKEYLDIQKKADMLEMFIDRIENMRLLDLAQKRCNDDSISFSDVVKENGISIDELEALSESVEFE